MTSFLIDDLRAFGYSPRLLERWRESGVAELLPLQVRAIRDYGFLRGNKPSNLLVLAPTSSGKTFVAELAALKHMEAGRRVIYLVPTRALAEEKGRQFQRRYALLGYKIAIATRERPETDALVSKGRFDLLVAVYEKMKAYLVARPEMLNQLGLVVVDEIQTLGERGRGEGLDLLLGKIVSSPWRPQFIGLSAVLGEGNRLADWLNCDLLLHRQRPVELREGVLDCSNGRFRYRCVNSGEEGEEALVDPQELPEIDHDRGQIEAAVAQFLAEALAEQVLIFVPTRHSSRALAMALAERVAVSGADEAVAELEQYEPTASRDLLLQCLRSGVGFHNADLSADLRALIEDYYLRGSIRILVSTSTLGQGVNLTGRNVIQIPQMATMDLWTGETTFVPLSNSRFRNQGGRAGRYQLEQGFGRSILLATGPDEAERLYVRYVAGELEPLEAPLRGRPLEAPVIDLVASGIARQRRQLEQMLFNTYTGISEWRGDSGYVAQAIDRALGCLSEKALLRVRENSLEATGLGKVMALHGISLETAARLGEWLSGLGRRIPSSFETLLILSMTVDGQQFPTPMSLQERRQADYLVEARERLSAECDACALLRDLLWPEGGLTPKEVASLKKAFLLCEWIGGHETAEIEEQFGMLGGSLANLASHVHWLARALMDAAEALGCARELRESLRLLSERLPLGLQEEAIGLARLHVEGLSRGAIQALVREGYDSLEALREADEESLARILPGRVAALLMDELHGREEANTANGGTQDACTTTTAAVEQDVCTTLAETTAASEPPAPTDILLEINGANRGIVRLNGVEVRLRPYPYQLLTMLARQTSVVLPRTFLAARLWPGEAREDQNLTHHYRSITDAFSAVIGADRARGLIEARRGLGIRLTLAPEQVKFLETVE